MSLIISNVLTKCLENLYLEANRILKLVFLINLRYADDTTLMAESEEQELLNENERGEWKSWLKAQHSEI